jgi:hypothetical protein
MVAKPAVKWFKAPKDPALQKRVRKAPDQSSVSKVAKPVVGTPSLPAAAEVLKKRKKQMDESLNY